MAGDWSGKMKELDLNTGLSTSSLRSLGPQWQWLVVGITERSSSQDLKKIIYIYIFFFK